MKQFDYIIAGAGAAGLTLAWLLTGFEDKEKTVLIVDKDSKSTNDRTWCFWEKGENLLEELVFKTWAKATVKTSDWEEQYTLTPYQYKMIRAIDFYEFMKQALQLPQVTWVEEEIVSISHEGIVRTNATEYQGSYVFDSTLDLNALRNSKSTTILQHFSGQVIHTPKSHFDSETATYMDFSIDQEGDCRFGYVLPFDSQTALVEYTLFNDQLLTEEAYAERLRHYIQHLGIESYEVKEEEYGIIPMTDFPFKTKVSDKVFNTGIKGGFAKASTGYSFLRSQKAMQKMAENIQSGLPPNHKLPYQSPRFRKYDATLLTVLNGGKYTGEDIFGKLFQKNGLHTMFRFLDEETSLQEELSIMSSTPILDFGKAFLQKLIS